MSASRGESVRCVYASNLVREYLTVVDEQEATHVVYKVALAEARERVMEAAREYRDAAEAWAREDSRALRSDRDRAYGHMRRALAALDALEQETPDA